ncbi:methionine--tRNA ligase [Candidatus Roizmanbacteria bacterium CG_4_10_14_0_2_um_filter_36_9]|uniref:Methionine--tRNA ligase n=1 Tax=Candidatus Roizmanbacteria bacterium CG_4_10_14_0_2_um_filter_36_9 TaxID=1974823 RepID=A0A2M7U686_9BACT|nr:MAG: methionine--tRNA ligase [Candidatus Roizmanbacteria bacterium CG_4_10_14_0_2_um_filter_36_9]
MKDTITYQDFIKLDIRVGEVTEATNVQNSTKLIRLLVDFGSDIGTRTILAGLAKWYAPSDFENQKFLFIVNLEPRKMAGEESQGMTLAADVDGLPKIVPAPNNLPNGTQIR